MIRPERCPGWCNTLHPPLYCSLLCDFFIPPYPWIHFLGHESKLHPGLIISVFSSPFSLKILSTSLASAASSSTDAATGCWLMRFFRLHQHRHRHHYPHDPPQADGLSPLPPVNQSDSLVAFHACREVHLQPGRATHQRGIKYFLTLFSLQWITRRMKTKADENTSFFFKATDSLSDAGVQLTTHFKSWDATARIALAHLLMQLSIEMSEKSLHFTFFSLSRQVYRVQGISVHLQSWVERKSWMP